MLVRIKHVTAVVPQLRVSEGKEFKMPSTDTDPIFQSSVDPSIDLVKLPSIGGRLNLLLIFIGDYLLAHPWKNIQVTRRNLSK